jgi:hypothetical protein
MKSGMDPKIYVNYKIDQNNFALTPEQYGQKQLDENFNITVILPFCKILNINDHRKIKFEAQKSVVLEKRIIISKYGKIIIKIERPADWQRFLNSKLLQFVGMITATLVSQGKEDFLWIEHSNEERVWIFGLIWNNHYWEGMLVERKRLSLGVDYFLTPEDYSQNYRRRYASELFRRLNDQQDGLGLPDNFPFCLNGLPSMYSQNRQLTIKVHPSETWFLLFPIDYFCRFKKYGQFSIYKEVEWILTPSKSFIQNSYERDQIRSELQDAENFLAHSIIILNTYPYFNDDSWVKERWIRGTNLVTKILSLVQDVEIGNNKLSLKWYINPEKYELHSQLLNQKTWYLFADFHVKNGVWQLGKEKTNSEFPLNFLEKDSLKHIRLMRVFHCHSVLDPYNPTGDTSITDLLLNAGALRVEGSIMEEDYLDYLCSLLYLFCHSQGLSPILMGKCLEIGIDFNNLVEEANDFQKFCEWNTTQTFEN